MMPDPLYRIAAEINAEMDAEVERKCASTQPALDVVSGILSPAAGRNGSEPPPDTPKRATGDSAGPIANATPDQPRACKGCQVVTEPADLSGGGFCADCARDLAMKAGDPNLQAASGCGCRRCQRSFPADHLTMDGYCGPCARYVTSAGQTESSGPSGTGPDVPPPEPTEVDWDATCTRCGQRFWAVGSDHCDNCRTDGDVYVVMERGADGVSHYRPETEGT